MLRFASSEFGILLQLTQHVNICGCPSLDKKTAIFFNDFFVIIGHDIRKILDRLAGGLPSSCDFGLTVFCEWSSNPQSLFLIEILS